MLDRPVLRALLALNMVVAAATGLVIVNTVVYVHDMLGSTNTALALLLACYGGGSMVIAVALPRVLHAIADRWVMLTGATVIPVVLAATAGLLVLHPSPAVGWAGFITAWILLGAATSLINTPSARLLRYQSAPDALPSVFTAQFSLSHACFFLTYLLAGWLGVAVGQPAAAATLAVLAAFAAILAARIWPAKHATISDPHRTPAAAHR